MLDVIVSIGLTSRAWTHSNEGLGLFLAMLVPLWYTSALPEPTYVHGGVEPFTIVSMFVCVDVLASGIHYATHKRWLGRRAFDSHQVHHRHVHPTPDDALHTGLLDACLQMAFPLLTALFLFHPNRTSATVFGSMYMHHLFHIHSESTMGVWPLVSPEYHRAHHHKPLTNFAHVLQWC